MYPDGTVLNYLFWMIMGILQVLVWKSIGAWGRQFNPNLRYWQQTLLYACFASFCVVIFAGFTLKGEYEGNAGWYLIGMFGCLHIIIFMVLTRFFIFMKKPGDKPHAATS